MSKPGGGKKKNGGCGCLLLLAIVGVLYIGGQGVKNESGALPTVAALEASTAVPTRVAEQPTAVPTVTTEAEIVSVAQVPPQPVGTEIARLAQEYPEPVLKAVLGAVEGVEQVTVAMVSLGPSVYSEVKVVAGAVNAQTADRLRLALVLEEDVEEWVFILDDGRLASDFTYRDGIWTATRLDISRSAPLGTPIPSPTRVLTRTPAPSTAVPAAAVVQMPDTDYWAANGINVRSCPSTSCEVVGRVNQGTRLTANGQIDGEAVNSGNKLWYRVRYGGGEAYVYSSVVTSSAPRPTAQPQVSAPQPQQPPPPQVSAPQEPAPSNHPAGASAICNDGTYSYSANRRGTCSHHGGVAQWL